MTQCNCRTFVPTVRDQDDICDFGANDRDGFEPPIFIEVKDRDVCQGVRPQSFVALGSSRQCKSHKQSCGYLVHRLLVILAWKQVPIAIHRDLKRRMAGECLHRLRREPRLDPT